MQAAAAEFGAWYNAATQRGESENMETDRSSWMASELIVLDIPATPCTDLCFYYWPDILQALLDWVSTQIKACLR